MDKFVDKEKSIGSDRVLYNIRIPPN